MPKSNLKDCPFCGGKPELKGRGGYWWITCACGITTAKSNASDAEDWQAYLWNCRPTPYAPDKSGDSAYQAEPVKEVSSPVESEPL